MQLASAIDLEKGAAVKTVCERLCSCPFFAEVNEPEEIADAIKEYIKVYCRGPMKDKCFRLQYLASHGEPPASSISPSGLDYRKYI